VPGDTRADTTVARSDEFETRFHFTTFSAGIVGAPQPYPETSPPQGPYPDPCASGGTLSPYSPGDSTPSRARKEREGGVPAGSAAGSRRPFPARGNKCPLVVRPIKVLVTTEPGQLPSRATTSYSGRSRAQDPNSPSARALASTNVPGSV
jgi:hypothetical protein